MAKICFVFCLSWMIGVSAVTLEEQALIVTDLKDDYYPEIWGSTIEVVTTFPGVQASLLRSATGSVYRGIVGYVDWDFTSMTNEIDLTNPESQLIGYQNYGGTVNQIWEESTAGVLHGSVPYTVSGNPFVRETYIFYQQDSVKVGHLICLHFDRIPLADQEQFHTTEFVDSVVNSFLATRGQNRKVSHSHQSSDPSIKK